MASGHTREMLGEALARDPADPVRGFLLIPPDREPGTVFAYSQPCTYTLASIIQRNAGMLLTEYLRPRLFDPLGIGPVGWSTFPPGRQQGFSGLHARTEDVAKLGQLYLQKGQWEGTQLIPAQWVEEATSAQVANPGEPNPDWQQGYGFQFWRSRHGYRGDGAFGQFCVILPDHETVVVTTASTLDMQAMLDALWTHLLPGLGVELPDAGSAQDELSARLAGLALPPCPAGSAPADPGAVRGGPFPVTALAAEVADAQIRPALTSVEVAPAESGWQVTLVEPSNALTFPVGAGTWTVSSPVDQNGATIPVAASGGWAGDGTLRVEVILLETPHRLDLTCGLPGDTATAGWRLPPIAGAKLRHLHSPA
jgi:hypothetical protein